MSVEELKKTVLEKARAEAEDIVKDALRRAEEILREAEETKRKIIEAEKNKIRSEIQAEKRIGEARRRARMIMTSVKSDLMKQIKENAIRILKEMDPVTREASLRKLIEEALREVRGVAGGMGSIEVYVSPGDRDLADRILRSVGVVNYTIRVDENILGGVRISCCDNTFVVDNTYNTRLSRALALVAKEVSREVGL
ncbi:V-type ATP synthase subunit E [Thermogladius sp. 4427co]|uniref:V-type ATP synthase subunit E n=1 Tax=Thermogladius sp. 4427co TaxID=3450718 RepID=UPI003F790B71